MTVLDAAGRTVALLAGLRLAPAGDTGADEADGRIGDLFYRMEWRPAETHPAGSATAAAPATRWLVCGDTTHLAQAVADGLRAGGCEVVRVRSTAQSSAGAEGEGEVQVIDPADREAWRALLDRFRGPGRRGVRPVAAGGPRRGARFLGIDARPDLRTRLLRRARAATVDGHPARAAAQGGYPLGLVGRTCWPWPHPVDGASGRLGRARGRGAGQHRGAGPGGGPAAAAPGEEHVDGCSTVAALVGRLERFEAPDEGELPPLSTDSWHLVTGAGRELAPPAVDWLLTAGARRIALVNSGPAIEDEVTGALPDRRLAGTGRRDPHREHGGPGLNGCWSPGCAPRAESAVSSAPTLPAAYCSAS